MIYINYKEYEWKDGMTVASLLKELKKEERYQTILASAPTVVINSRVVEQKDYDEIMMNDGDEVMLYPLIVGG